MTDHYTRHIFFCINQRDCDNRCCADYAAIKVQTYAKSRLKQLGMLGKNKLRVNRSGCLGRCEEGPVVVVYPEGVWYSYVDEEDIDEIIERHLINGEVVSRLLI